MAEKTVWLTPVKHFQNSEHGKLMTDESPEFEASPDYARQLKANKIAIDFEGKPAGEKLPAAAEPEVKVEIEPSRAVAVEHGLLALATGQPEAKAAPVPENKMAPAPANKAEPAPRKKRPAPPAAAPAAGKSE